MRILLILFLVSFMGCVKKEKEQELSLIAVKILKVKKTDVPIYIYTIGHVKAYQTADIKPQITGKLIQTFFEPGKKINKGDLIAKIDDRAYLASLEEAKGALEQSLANLKNNQDIFNRNTPLREKDYVSREFYDNLATKVLIDEATVKSHAAQVESASINLDYCYLRAPFDGIAGDRNIDPGNLVTSGSTETIVTINQIKPIHCEFSISEKTLPQLQQLFHDTFLSVDVSFVEDFKENRTGNLVFIDNSVNPNTGMIKLKALFNNEDAYLWPEEYVNVRLLLDVKKNAILIPDFTIQRNGNDVFVFVIKNNIASKRKIILGPRIQENFIVLEGLEEGDNLVTEGQYNLYEGTKVAIQ